LRGVRRGRFEVNMFARITGMELKCAVRICEMSEVEEGPRLEVTEKKNRPPVQLQEYWKFCPKCGRGMKMWQELNGK